MEATLVLEASAERRVGSSPTWGTKYFRMVTAIKTICIIDKNSILLYSYESR